MPRIVSAGIWRPSFIEFRPKNRIEEAYMQTLSISEDKKQAELLLYYKINIAGSENENINFKNWELIITGCCGNSSFEKKEKLKFIAGHMQFSIGDPILWWPKGRGQPNLYKITISLLQNSKIVDTFTFNHGIRTVELLRTSVTGLKGEGEFCFKINNEKTFVKGTNWVPLDAFHSRDKERVEEAVSLVVDLGCNMIRCWGGNVYENTIFYNLCDENGIMVWQDFAMACAVYPQDEEFCKRIEYEVTCTVKRLRQHPCIVLWCGDNECDTSYLWFKMGIDPNSNIITRRVIPKVLRLHDPIRPYLPSSPYILEWENAKSGGVNHYVSGNPPFDAEKYIKMLNKLIDIMKWDHNYFLL